MSHGFRRQPFEGFATGIAVLQSINFDHVSFAIVCRQDGAIKLASFGVSAKGFKQVNKRRYIITGAASGIGAATARRLSGPGVCLTLHTRGNRVGLAAVVETCRKADAEVSECLGDLSDPGEAKRLVRHAETAFGDIDGLVTAAGFADVTSIKDLDAATLMESHAAIDQAFALLVQNALPCLQNSPAGRIVAVSSFVAHNFQLGGKFLPASAMAKAGLEALVKSFAVRTGH